MTWVRIEPEMAHHPKLLEAGPLAAWLDIAGLCWCNEHRTNGKIPHSAVPTLINTEGFAVRASRSRLFESWDDVSPHELATILVEVGRWRETDAGYEIHDYAEFQPSRDEVLSAERQRREAGKRSATARRTKRERDAQRPVQGGEPIGGDTGSGPGKEEPPPTDPRYEPILAKLRLVAAAKGAKLNEASAVEACERYADRDHPAEAEKFRLWHVDGKGSRRKPRQIAQSWWKWLETADPMAPQKAGARPEGWLAEVA